MSTNLNPAYLKAGYYEVKNVDGKDFRDVLTTRLISNIRAITSIRTHIWTQDDKLENLCFKYYGTTTVYWLVMIYNGIVCPFSIMEGAMLKFPSFSDMTKALTDEKKHEQLNKSANSKVIL